MKPKTNALLLLCGITVADTCKTIISTNIYHDNTSPERVSVILPRSMGSGLSNDLIPDVYLFSAEKKSLDTKICASFFANPEYASENNPYWPKTALGLPAYKAHHFWKRSDYEMMIEAYIPYSGVDDRKISGKACLIIY